MISRKGTSEYFMEAAGLGAFMLSACLCTVAIEHPGLPLRTAIESALARRGLMGAAMGATAIAITYSPWGRRSGAHINPSVTLAFLRLGRITRIDAAAYVAFQTLGALAGVLLAALLAGPALQHPAVHFAVTVPGGSGVAVAFAAELAISALLMTAVLVLSGTPALAPRCGLVCGTLVAAFITFEAPLSGMSMNPARTLASGVFAGDLRALWLYLTAPPLGMLLAAEFHLLRTEYRGQAPLFGSVSCDRDDRACPNHS
ncbi:MAG TPA: aquaporin [Candidatus Binatia bacterium]|nr:aquaporin [Candidatus Binatia bacterium]